MWWEFEDIYTACCRRMTMHNIYDEKIEGHINFFLFKRRFRFYWKNEVHKISFLSVISFKLVTFFWSFSIYRFTIHNENVIKRHKNSKCALLLWKILGKNVFFVWRVVLKTFSFVVFLCIYVISFEYFGKLSL